MVKQIRKRAFATLMTLAMVISLLPAVTMPAKAVTIGTADGTYDFGELGLGGSGGADYKKLGDKFIVSSAFVQFPPDTLIFPNDADGVNTHGASADLVIKAEGTTVNKKFTFKDMNLSTEPGGDFNDILDIFTITFKDASGATIGHHELQNNVQVPETGINISQFPFTQPFPVNGYDNVSEIHMTCSYVTNYFCWLEFNTITIANVTATLATPPTVTTQPNNATANAGSNTSFTVVATGATAYKWQVDTNSGSGFSDITNGGVYSNATTATLNITGATAGMNGYQYKAVVSGSAEPAATSDAATLTVNSAPTDISLSATSVNENVAANTTVGTLSSTDPDASNTFTYSLVAGTGSTDNAAFNISGSSLRISNSPDFETKSSYSVRVGTTDQGGLTYEEAFTITINDLNETPTDISLSSSSVNENVAGNTTVGTLLSTDPDAANTFTYSLVAGTGSTDNASFNISGSSLRITNSPDFETKNSYSVRIRTTDQGTLFFEKSFTITINNINEPPTDITLTATSLNQSGGLDAVVGTLGTTDVDNGDSFTYTLVSGDGDTNNLLFNISGSALRANNAAVLAAGPYSVRVRTTDSGSLTYEKAFTITVTDNVAPMVSTVSVPADGTYKAGQNLDFTVNFNENVTVDTLGGTPRIALTIGATTRYATYQSGSGTSALVFRYTVQAGNNDSNGITVGALSANGGTMQDAAGNNATLTLNSVGNTTNVLVDATSPAVSSIVRQTPANSLTNAASVIFRVTFNESVTGVDISDFALTKTGDADGTVALVSPVSGTIYDVTVNTISGDGTLRLDLNDSGTGIEDAGGNAIAGGYSTGETYTIDNTAPTIQSGTLSAENTYIDILFSEDVYGDADGTNALTASKFSLTFSMNGGTATNASIHSIKTNTGADLTGGETTVRVFLTVTGTPNGLETIEIKPANGTSVYDKAGNAMLINQTSGIKQLNDKTPPTISSVSVPTAKTYKGGETLSFTVNFSKAVTVTGIPTLALDIGGAAVNAAYVNGDNTSALVFAYTIVDGNTDINGIDIGALSLNGGAIKDAVGNDASLTLNSVGSTVGVLVDTTAPTAGNTGTIEVSELTYNSAKLTWTAGTDDITVNANLQYKVVYSTSNNISTLSDAETNGTAFGGWSANITSTTVTGLTANTDYYFNVLVKDEAGNMALYSSATGRTTAAPSGGGSDSMTGSTVVEVNGQKQDAGTTATTTTGGQTTTTIKVDDTKLNTILETSGAKPTVTLPVSGNSDVVVGELTGQTVKNMENKAATLVIKTEAVTYTLPASQINIDAVSSQLGAQVDLKDIKVSVRIAEPPADTVKVVQDTANKNSYQIVVKPVEFEITCTSGDKTVEVSKFNGYVERTVAIPDGVDPSKITTGIVLNSDGTFRHVPTTVIKIDGKYYAKINSLTNSTYSVIYNPVSFADVASHWAKTAINDMGSRMVVTGIGNGTYEPDRSITRAEFAAIVVRAMGLQKGTTESSFGDVTLTDWFNGYVDTATAYSLITGYDSASYGPNDTITREQAMAILARAMKLTGLSISLTDSETSELLAKYTDGASVSDYAKMSAAICIKSGVVTGSSATTLSPKAYVTRAEVAVMVQRLLQKSGLI